MTNSDYADHKEYIKKYLGKFDDIKIRVPHDSKHNREYYRDKAKKELGYASLNDYVIAMMDYGIKNKLTAKKIKGDATKNAKGNSKK